MIDNNIFFLLKTKVDKEESRIVVMDLFCKEDVECSSLDIDAKLVPIN